MSKKYLEIETKYDASEIDRLEFKRIVDSLDPKSFIYVESSDVYYVNKDGLFLRYRMPVKNMNDPRAELTPKIKHIEQNNIVRTEPNLRVDGNDPERVKSFCNSIGFNKNFSIYKMCDIYHFEDAILVYYTVKDENNKHANFLEIEVNEDLDISQEEGMAIIHKYEKLLAPLGITPQKRKRLSLFEMYRKPV
jgi:adenylate cyclase class IV